MMSVTDRDVSNGDVANGRRSVHSLDRALQLLEAFPATEAPVRLNVLAQRTGLPASTAHRLLDTLANHGFVVNEGDGAYRLGIRIWELGARVVRQRGLTPVMVPYLEELVSEIGETGHVSVLDGEHVVYVGRLPGERSLSVQTYLGQRAPALCTATGRALLSRQPPHVADNLLKASHAQDGCPARLNEDEIRARLELARQDGFVVNIGGWQDDMAGVAAPIVDFTSFAVAAIGVAGPRYRHSDEEWREFGPLVRDVAQRMSSELGALA